MMRLIGSSGLALTLEPDISDTIDFKETIITTRWNGLTVKSGIEKKL
jgi:hypothetical protein